MSSSSPRGRKIEAQLQRVLASLIAREVKDPRVGTVTITAVGLSPDKALAKVYFMPFASTHPAEEVRRGLMHAGGFLRGAVGRALGLRHAPQLEFVIDDMADRAAALTGLIDRAIEQDESRHKDS